ncbi:TPA: sigma-70 family RNA polymerase sigma factor [Clostridioides difficile]|nr:sigma-70 family RNA polymerase sigma factor [Clostridioides difficile]
MRVKREYMQKVKMELNSIGNMKRKKEFLKKEIEVLKKQDNYSEINFNKLGYKTYHSANGIDDMIVNTEEEIFIKETEIEFIDKRLEMINIYIDELEDEEKEIIKLRFLYKGTRRMTIERIAKKLMCSENNVYKKCNNAIRKIAIMKFPKESILEKEGSWLKKVKRE